MDRKYFVTFPTDLEDRLIVARTPKDAARKVFRTVPGALATGVVKVDRTQTRFYEATPCGDAEVFTSTASKYYAVRSGFSGEDLR